jgi:hypothetical protein
VLWAPAWQKHRGREAVAWTHCCVALREHRRGAPAQHGHPSRCVSPVITGGKSQDGALSLEKKSDLSKADSCFTVTTKCFCMGRNLAPVTALSQVEGLLLQKSGLLAFPWQPGKLWGGTGQKEVPEPQTATEDSVPKEILGIRMARPPTTVGSGSC